MANYTGFNNQDDTLRGTSASDNFYGSTGNDTIIGGGGDDSLVYSSAGTFSGISGTVNVTFSSSTLYSGTAVKSAGGTDTFTGIRGVTGTSGADHFVGTTLPSLYSNLTIFFRGGAGSDYMDGRNNAENQANYRDASVGITVDFGATSDGSGNHTGSASDGQGGTDTLVNVVRVRGGNFNDSVAGSTQSDIFDASLGSDVYDGRGGSNTITYDTAEFSGNTRAVVVTAGAPVAGLYGLGTASIAKYLVADGSLVGTDTATNVNQFRGSDGGDTLIGTTAAYSFFSYRLQGAAGNDLIYGQNSTANRADYASASSAVTVDLAAGTAQDGQGGADTLIGVRGVQASSYNDTLLGGYQSDVFIIGSAGQHTVNGRGGANAVYYTGSDNVTIDLGTTTTSDGYGGYQGSIAKSAGTDTLANVANAQGGSGNDTVRGTPGANQLEGGSGTNTIDGRDGYDTVNYQYFSGLDTPTRGATVNLDDGVNGTATNPWGGTDTLLNIEAVTGSQFADDLTGANLALGANSYVRGEGGNDILRAPSAGTHVVADYADSLSGVTVDLRAGVTSDDGWFGGTDTLINIQAVRGSRFADTFTSGFGNDTLAGGTGSDTVNFHGSAGEYVVKASLGADLSLQYIVTDNGAAGDGVDTLTGIETLHFSDTTVALQLDAAPSAFGAVAHDGHSAGGEVYALYEGLLGRAPDVVGMEVWAAQLNAGVSANNIAAALLASPEGQARAGASDNAAFVEQLYQTNLGRPSDAVGSAYWTGQLNGGTSRADVAVGFALSDEHLGSLSGAFDTGVFVPDANADNVARLYYGVLGRAPDAGGLAALTNQVGHGASLASVAAALLASGEYKVATTGLTDPGFVDALYHQVLDRAGDSGGVATWNDYLAHGGARGTVIDGFTGSGEFQGKYAGLSSAGYVEQLYEHILGRSGDGGGVAEWTRQLDAGLKTRGEVAQAFTGSGEFQAKYVQPGAAQYVDDLYVAATGRHADAGGSGYWVDQLAHGVSRAGVAVAVAESGEAQAHHLADIEQGWHLA